MGNIVPSGDIPQADFWVCKKPNNRSGKPCYDRRCGSQNCRNKCAWKERTTLVRSLKVRPATHFITLNFPWHYTGKGCTQKINDFFDLLKKRVGCEMYFHWRYDGQEQGRYPHVHVLVQCERDISSWLVHLSWCNVWPDEEIEEKDSHVRRCDSDYREQANYMAPDEPTKLVRKADWCGRLSGGSRKFWATTRKVLFKDEHYRETRENLAYSELLERFESEWGNYWIEKAYRVSDSGEGKGSSVYVFTPHSPPVPPSPCPCMTAVQGPLPPILRTWLLIIYPIPPPERVFGRKEG